jgi:hypothetical protein
VKRGVADGENETGIPINFPYSAMEKISSLLKGSPPVIIKIGGGKPKPLFDLIILLLLLLVALLVSGIFLSLLCNVCTQDHTQKLIPILL